MINRNNKVFCLLFCFFTCIFAISLPAGDVEPNQSWKNEITYPDEPFCSWTWPSYVKFTIISEDFDSNVVYYQDSNVYLYHYDFAADCLEPFKGMSLSEYDRVTLYEEGQQAVLGAVIFSPQQDPPINEYGIRFTRYDPYTREQIVQMFNIVKNSVISVPNVHAFYFPTYEQYPVASQNRDWFEQQGIPIGSTAQWAQGNMSYSDGWALGRLKYFFGDEIQTAYITGELLPGDILLTNAVPSEIPSVAGLITLTPATPNSHVAILARSQGVPFVYLVPGSDIDKVQQYTDHDIYLSVKTESMEGLCGVKLLDFDGVNEQDKSSIYALKKAKQINIQSVQHKGRFSCDTSILYPSDIVYFGGKASNFGILRRSIPDNSPPAMAFSFDLWNDFLNQPLSVIEPITIEPGGYFLFWADGDIGQGLNHTSFKLNKSGEELGLFDTNGITMIDGLSFGSQKTDISFGRIFDGAQQWQFINEPTPGWANSVDKFSNGLVINEFMADNKTTIEDEDESEEYSDWIELYNGSNYTVVISGMYLTDDFNEPTKWQIPVPVENATLREEITDKLSRYTSYPPSNMKDLSADLSTIRNIFLNPNITVFSSHLQDVIINALQSFGFKSGSNIRFRSSTNMEDSEQFTGAGLYESFSGCLADDLDDNDEGPCLCDQVENNERGVFDAIRKVFASFYNDNAFLERLRYGINEAEVGMALLVHQSFPDEIETANGVVTLEKIGSAGWSAVVSCQMGAVSVTNPPEDVVPEIVRIEAGSWGVSPWVVQNSSLVPLRQGTVMQWEDDYIDLYELLVKAGDEYAQIIQKDELLLDFEFKKIAPDDRLIIKQIREIPKSENEQYGTPYLFAEPRYYWSLQGRGGNVFTNHRLKSRWTLSPRSTWLSEENVQQSIYEEIEIEFVSDGWIQKISGKMSDLPDAEYFYEEPQTEFETFKMIDIWGFSDIDNPRSYKLQTQPLFYSELSDPVVTQDDLRLTVEVEYGNPVPLNEQETTMTETISLYEPWQPSDDLMEQFSYDDPNTGISILTQFYVLWQWGAGPTPTSIQFGRTHIEGLTSEPIELSGYFSQSIGAGAHLCPKQFLFEPQLEPGINPSILEELRAKDIRLIYLDTGSSDCRPNEWDDTDPTIRIYGFDEE